MTDEEYRSIGKQFFTELLTKWEKELPRLLEGNKAMSWLDTSSGGALVPPPHQPIKKPKKPSKSLNYQTKSDKPQHPVGQPFQGPSGINYVTRADHRTVRTKKKAGASKQHKRSGKKKDEDRPTDKQTRTTKRPVQKTSLDQVRLAINKGSISQAVSMLTDLEPRELRTLRKELGANFAGDKLGLIQSIKSKLQTLAKK